MDNSNSNTAPVVLPVVAIHAKLLTVHARGHLKVRVQEQEEEQEQEQVQEEVQEQWGATCAC
jgi:hypothetical protein